MGNAGYFGEDGGMREVQGSQGGIRAERKEKEKKRQGRQGKKPLRQSDEATSEIQSSQVDG